LDELKDKVVDHSMNPDKDKDELIDLLYDILENEQYAE